MDEKWIIANKLVASGLGIEVIPPKGKIYFVKEILEESIVINWSISHTNWTSFLWLVELLAAHRENRK